MNKINVLGLGPGSMEYILPAAIKKIEESDIIIGGRRHIESLGKYAENKEHFYITADLTGAVDFINHNRSRKISLIVSGDTGFYSMLTFMRKHFREEELAVVPGISSIQYMFAKISDYWYDACISSVHGKEYDYAGKLEKYGKVGLLTDFKENTPQKIAEKLTEKGMGKATVYIGENLSYDDEKIYEYRAEELKDIGHKFKMNVVILKL